MTEKEELAQISKILSEHGYELVSHIGTGSFSSVYLCNCAKYNHQFAIKRILKEKFVPHECDSLISLENPHIIKLYLTFEEGDSIFLVMEFCPNGTFRKKGNLDYDKFIYYSKQILEALAFCHSKNIAHRDIKPDNIFLDQYDHIKIGDFGLSKQFDQNVKCAEKCGSLMFSAPEILLKKSISPFQTDIWALGITFFFMASGKYPFPNDIREDLKVAIMMGQLDYSMVNLHPKIQSLIKKMTTRNPSLRLTAEELLQLPIFKPAKRQISKTISMFSYQKNSLIKSSSPNFQYQENNLKPGPVETKLSDDNEKKRMKLHSISSVSQFSNVRQIRRQHSFF